MSFNVWQPQGNVVANPGVNKLGNPSVIFDTNPQVLAGPNVFKMWAGLDTNGKIYYFESADGLTNWTALGSNPITPSGSAAFFPTVYKQGSTYYLYGSATSFPGNGITVYTSTDGVTFTSQGLQIALGSGGSWDSTGIFQLNIVDIIGGIWYAYYSGYNGVTFAQGLVTSTDGIHWTKSANNPIFPAFIGNMCFLKSGNVYYAYAQFVSPNQPPALVTSQNVPIGRWSAGSPSGPWVPLTFNGVQVPTYYMASSAELNNSNALPVSSINDQRMVVANGNIYLYYTYTTTGGIEQSVNAALASGMTPAQLVATYEGVVNVPFIGVPQLNLNILASDTFQRANVNPLGGNWSPTINGFTSQIVGLGRVENSAPGQGDSFWNAATFPNDQWSQTTILSEVAGSFIGAETRCGTSGANNTAYRLILQGGTGAGAQLIAQKDIANTTTNLAQVNFTISPNDTVMQVVIGTSILTYWNNYLINVSSDSSITSGAAGFELAATTSIANVALSAWSGGGFQSAPGASFIIFGNVGKAGAIVSYSGTASGSVTADSSGNYAITGLSAGTYTITPSSAGVAFSPLSQVETINASIGSVNFTLSTVYSVPDCRNFGGFPNLAVNVNGTLTYTIQQSESRKAGAPVDSRTAGAPAADGTYPQNSRTPGVFGPDE